MVVAPGRASRGRWSTFLRAQGINVRTADDADTAFEEALLHPPDVVLIDDRVPPAGGVDLCPRLKDNVRTHFVPVIVCALNDLRSFRLRALAAGADAVFAPVDRRAGAAHAALGAAAHARALQAGRAEAADAADRRSSSGATGCRTSCTI